MNEVLAGLSVVSTICAIVFGYVAFARNGKRDVADEAKSDATVLTEIGYIKANTDEIKAEQKEQRKTNVEVVTRPRNRRTSDLTRSRAGSGANTKSKKGGAA